MSKNNIIDVFCFNVEIGKLGFDENKNQSFFQYNPAFLANEKYKNIFPYAKIIRRIPNIQLFKNYNNETFRGLPPMIADSLPDVFGNIIFKTWLESNNKNFNQINVLEQLAYVANRGMGALEFKPSKEIPKGTTIDIEEISAILKLVLSNKQTLSYDKLNSDSLLNFFKIGTSAGGARPKILISENKETGAIIPGDIDFSEEYNHYLVKLSIDVSVTFNRELIEYSYYLAAIKIGITMMPSKMIDKKHFATLRFDRQNGAKQHVLTATGITGWDFRDSSVSNYENLFELAIFLKLPQSEIKELFKRMIFNIVFCNTDDHLKNHAFIYNEKNDKWNVAPAYDVTYSINPLINFKRVSRALSINNKRIDITVEDVLTIAKKYTIKNAIKIIKEVNESTLVWHEIAKDLKIPSKIIKAIGNFPLPMFSTPSL
jgi:serine/threonine-protein kinase HipA